MIYRWLRDLALCFAAGSAGGAAKGVVVWICAHFPATAAFGAQLAGALHAQNLPYANGLYPRIVWGGLCGFLFLLPLARNAPLVSGFLWGLLLTIVQWLLLPLLHGGLRFALLPIIATLLLNCVWGWVAALLLRGIR